MKRIISASYREDIPAFGAKQFYENVAKGYVDVPTKLGWSRTSLRPEDVYCYVFWTKNPSKAFIDGLKTLMNPFYFQWTITSYPKQIEPAVPDKETVIDTFRRLSLQIGPERVIWRYDPIFVSDVFDVEYHIEKFEKMCKKLKGCTTKCVISFMDEYGKIADAVKAGILRAPTKQEVHAIAKAFGEIAPRYGIKVQTCSEGHYDLTAYGITEEPCIDPALIERLTGETLADNLKKPNSFRRCKCAVNTDIGQYHRCSYGCVYCYAK